jgi:hypothetical protein
MFNYKTIHADNFTDENGMQLLKDCFNGFNGMEPEQLKNYVSNVFETNPEIKAKVQKYVADQGFTPSDAVTYLAAQFSEARKAHIKSNAENFDGKNVESALYNSMFEDTDEFCDIDGDCFTPEALDASHANILANEAFYGEFEEAAGTIDSGLNPDPTGDAERKKQNTATLIGSILGLGSKVIADIKEKKAKGEKTNFNALLEILKKKGKAQIDETKAEITEREKNRYIESQLTKVKQNLPLVIGGVIVVVLLIVVVAKKAK